MSAERRRRRRFPDLPPTTADPQPGPTGQHSTGGPLFPGDEGELNVAVTEIDGKIVIHFGTAVRLIGLGPSEARQFAAVLLKRADEIEDLNQ